jgi:hypothetical protein
VVIEDIVATKANSHRSKIRSLEGTPEVHLKIPSVTSALFDPL